MTTKRFPRLRRWLKGLGIALLILLLLLVVFHRPLVFEGTRYFVVRAAKQQNLDVSYDIEGSIFSTLTIRNLVGRPTESGPIQRLEVGELNLRYSLVDAARKGLPALLELVDVRNVHVEITPGEPEPPPKERQPQRVKFPALFPETLNLENINFTAHAPTGDTVLRGLHFSLLPDREGRLVVEVLDIPGVRRWEGIAGRTTYRERNLVLTDLRIGPEIALERFNLDASRLDEQELRVGLEGALFGASTTLVAHVADLNGSNRLDVRASVTALPVADVFRYLNLPPPLTGVLQAVDVNFRGEPERPVTWDGGATVAMRDARAGGQTLGAVDAGVTFASAQATATFSVIPSGANRLDGWAVATLPEQWGDFPKTSADARVTLAAPDLAALAPDLGGAAFAGVDAQLRGGVLDVGLNLAAPNVLAAGVEAQAVRVQGSVRKRLPERNGEPVFRGLETNVTADVASVRGAGYATDAIRAVVQTREDVVTVEEFRVRKAANHVTASVNYRLPADLRAWTTQPFDARFEVQAPELHAFLAPGSAQQLGGTLSLTGNATGRAGVFNGGATIVGRDLAAQGLRVRSVDGEVTVAEHHARVPRFVVVMDDRNRITASGEATLSAPHVYRGKADVRIEDLAAFQTLVGATPVAGRVIANWRGEGDAQAHGGRATVEATGVRFGEYRDIGATLAADYSRDQRVRVSALSARLGRQTLIEGTADLPLDFTRTDQPLALSLKTPVLELRPLLVQLGQNPAPVAGTAQLEVTANGTLRDLVARVALRGRGIEAAAAEQVDPADVSLDLDLRDDRLGVSGDVRQRLIQPLTIRGNVPLDVERLLNDRALDPGTPVDLRVSLPRSSLAFVSALVPAIRQIRGDASVDVRVGGTVGAPAVSGAVAVDLSTLRLTDPSLPPVNDFTLRLGFADNRLVLRECRGGLAGGTFGAAGGVDFRTLDNPALDLRLFTRNALVLQNDDLTARVTSDVRVTGPLNAATVSGTVGVTRSRFFKDIDILPIGLPGRPAPQPPPEPSVVTFPQPPLRDWRFDVAIRTADAFLVESNLARGRITMDLRLGGTGLEPWMEGNVRIEQLSASLPFSRLNIDSGLIYFTRDAPFEPKLNLRGTSTIRDYDVSVTIFGTASAPQAVFSSNPPLPQAEVVSLIATGTTTEELGRDPNALAGRAAMLAFQKLYRTVFKPKPGREPRPDTFLSRVQLDAGATDPKTGRQSVTARVPLSEQFALVGGVDVGGNFRGQVKYLVRFR